MWGTKGSWKSLNETTILHCRQHAGCRGLGFTRPDRGMITITSSHINTSPTARSTLFVGTNPGLMAAVGRGSEKGKWQFLAPVSAHSSVEACLKTNCQVCGRKRLGLVVSRPHTSRCQQSRDPAEEGLHILRQPGSPTFEVILLRGGLSLGARRTSAKQSRELKPERWPCCDETLRRGSYQKNIRRDRFNLLPR